MGVERTAGRDDGAVPAIAAARRLDGRLHAFTEIFAQPQPAQAGPLAGMAYAVKDLADFAGHAATLGLAQAPGASASANAPVIDRINALGGSLIGFTAMTPLAYEPSGGNALQGRPLNPWSADHICGGSSSGSAVAVAAGIVPVALGSDTGGSLRIPAHCCGVTAWKPTYGLVPAAGTMALAPSLDSIGFVARRATDLVVIADAFAGAKASAQRIGMVAIAHDMLANCDEDIVNGMENAVLAMLRTAMPTRETRLAHLIAACDGPVMALMQGEAALAHRALIDSGDLPPTLATRLGKGSAIDAAQMQQARDALAELGRDALDAAFGGADAILLPVMRIRTPTVAVCEPDSPDFSPRTLYALSALTRWVNGLGLPAVAIPCGFDRDGLPMAVQIVGRPNADVALLNYAATLQKGTDWHGRTPTGLAAAGELS